MSKFDDINKRTSRGEKNNSTFLSERWPDCPSGQAMQSDTIQSHENREYGSLCSPPRVFNRSADAAQVAV